MSRKLTEHKTYLPTTITKCKLIVTIKNQKKIEIREHRLSISQYLILISNIYSKIIIIIIIIIELVARARKFANANALHTYVHTYVYNLHGTWGMGEFVQKQ